MKYMNISDKHIFILSDDNKITLDKIITKIGSKNVIDIFTSHILDIYKKNIRVHNIDTRYFNTSKTSNMYFNTVISNFDNKRMIQKIKEKFLNLDEFKYYLYLKLIIKTKKQIMNIVDKDISTILTKKLDDILNFYKVYIKKILYLYENTEIEYKKNLIKKYSIFIRDILNLYIVSRIFRKFNNNNEHPYIPFRNNKKEYTESPRYIILYNLDKKIYNYFELLK